MAPGIPIARPRLLALAVLLALAAAAPGAAAEPAAFFRVPCATGHLAADDPIVLPGRPGASHLHQFFGNRTTDALSTYRTLRAGTTTCRRAADRAAYWAPALRAADGRVVRPRGAEVYYRGDRHADVRAVRAFPQGLRMIAGSPHATRPQPTAIAGWHCGPDGTLETEARPPLCPAGRELRLQVRFPDCWDGRRLDSPGHASHMAYARAGRCPASHPVAVPQIVLNIRYPLRDGRGVTLASGAPHTAHADFINAWDAGELRRLVRVCIRRRRGNERACRPGVPTPLPLRPRAWVVAHGERVTLAGREAGPRDPVRLQLHRHGVWEYVAQTRPRADGSYAFTVRAGASRSYRALVGRRPTEVVRVGVRPRVGIAVDRSGDAVRIRVRTTPGKGRVVVRAERGGGRRTAVRSELRTRRGRAVATLRLAAGRYTVRALTRGDRRHAAGRSRPVTLDIP